MPKLVSFDKTKILKGLNETVDTVKSTLGPKGRNVFIDDQMEPKITNDGVTIANSISFEDAEENAGAYLVKNTSGQTNDNAGDGTTTTAILLQATIAEALKRPENPMEVRASLMYAVKDVVKDLKKLSVPVKTSKQIQQIATISSESEEHGKMITEIIDKVGKDGIITIEDSRTFTTDYEIVEGYEAMVGFMSPHFITDPKEAKAIYEKVPVAVFEHKIDTLADIKYLYEVLKAEGLNSIVLVCHDIDNSVLGTLIMNKLQGNVNTLVIRAAHPDFLDDIASTVGATVIAQRTGVPYDQISMLHLGTADKVISSEKKTIFFSKKSRSLVQSKRLRQLADNTENTYEKSKLLERAAKLEGQIAVIRVGAPTDMEKWYLKHKLEDAVNATQSAIEEGIVEGGGMALYRIGERIKPVTIGEHILKRVLNSPLRTIIENAGLDYTDILLNMPEGRGYDAHTGKYVDLITSGIIDPTKVERCALENAVSTAATFVTTTAIIVEAPKKDHAEGN